MKRKFSIITIIMAMLLIVSACSAQEKPDKVVSEYIDAMKNFDFETMASKINPEDEEAKQDISELYEEGEDEFQDYFKDYMKTNAKKIEYDIEESTVDGDNGVVKVKFKYIDGGPLFRATFEKYMEELFALAFSGKDLTEEENFELLRDALEEKSESMEETFTEKTVDIKCIKIEDEWYIDDPSEEMLDIMTSNMIKALEEIDDDFDFDDDEDSSILDEEETKDLNIIEKELGEEVSLSTLELKVTSVEEVKTLEPLYDEEIKAKDGAKFVLVSMDITNTTKSGIEAPGDLVLIDNEEREFNTYGDSIGAVDDYLNYRDLAPSITESGRYIYELPEDSKGYYLYVEKAETDDAYKIILK